MIDLTGDDDAFSWRSQPKRPRTQEPARAPGIRARSSNEDIGIEIVRSAQPARDPARSAAALPQGDDFEVLEDGTKVRLPSPTYRCIYMIMFHVLLDIIGLFGLLQLPGFERVFSRLVCTPFTSRRHRGQTARLITPTVV